MTVARGSYIYDHGRQPQVYSAGRDLTPSALANYLKAWRTHIAPDTIRRAIDLGAGTGRFSGPIADTFDCDVIAVEPSEGM